MHVQLHYKNNLIDKKDSYPFSCPPSWDDRNYSYGHQLYPSEYIYFKKRSQSKFLSHYYNFSDIPSLLFKNDKNQT
jgi:hypothetical protein